MSALAAGCIEARADGFKVDLLALHESLPRLAPPMGEDKANLRTGILYFRAHPALPTLAARSRHPFSHPDWLFEIKWDGFRSLAQVDNGRCRLISRKRNEFKSFGALNEAIVRELKTKSAVLDGEIVCLDEDGKPQFRDLLFRRGEPRFIAFDILWLDGEDLRPLTDRKHRLRSVIPSRSERLMYCDHVDHDGVSLFELACQGDLEGVVAKCKTDPYLDGHARWLKIRNRGYTQWAGREKLFERERGSDPDGQLWESCVTACVSAGNVR